MLIAGNMVLVGELRVTFSNFFQQEVSGMEIPPRPVWLHSHNRKKCLVPGLLQRRTYALFEFPSPCVLAVLRFYFSRWDFRWWGLIIRCFFFVLFRKYFIIGLTNYVKITTPDIERKQIQNNNLV